MYSLRSFLHKVNLNSRLILLTNSRTIATKGESFEDYPFLRNCETETCDPVPGTVTGKIPLWLEGELIRNGPGIQKIGNDQYRHIFDGLAILHKFTVKDGKAQYQSRFLQSDTYKKNKEANRIVVSEFGTYAIPDPCQNWFGRMKTEFKAVLQKKNSKGTDNCCINVAYYGDQLYAMTETSLVRRIDPFSLNCIGEKTDINDYVAVNLATAHPHVLEDGSIINLGTNFRHQKGSHYCFIKVPPSFNSEETSFANAKLLAEIPAKWKMYPSYFHSFGITTPKNGSAKLIFIEYPYSMNLLGLVAGGILKKSFNEWISWYPNEKTRIHVVSLDNGKRHPVIYEAEKLFTFHHINAFEENGELIVDVSAYDDAEWVGHITKDDTKKPGNFSEHPSARRYVLPLNVESAKAGENLVKKKSKAKAVLRGGKETVVDVTPEHLFNGVIDLPRINYAHNGKDYSYFYGVGQKKQAETYDMGFDILYKVNVKTGETIPWVSNDPTPARVSEPVFVANPTKANPEEDDGVVLAGLLPNNNPTSVSLLVLNAKDMREIARAEFTAKGAVTGTFHGQWAGQGKKIHGY